MSHLQAAKNKHYPGIFAGVLNISGDSDPIYGIEYEYKLTDRWGAGFIYESSNDAKDGKGVDVSVLSGFYHPNKNWRLGLGLGREEIGGSKPKEKNIAKFSIAYEHYIGSVVLAPTIAVDFVEGGDQAYVAGIAVLFPF